MKDELSTLAKKDMPNKETLNQKLKISAILDAEKRSLERGKLLINGAIDQYIFENKVNVESKVSKLSAVLNTIIRNEREIIEENNINYEEDLLFSDI